MTNEETRAQYGWLDANIFIHALFEDEHRERCRAILRDLQAGRAEASLDHVTIHELTYALPRRLPDKFQTRQDVFDFLSRFIVLDTVYVDGKETVLKGLKYWAQGTSSRYGDTRLAALAEATGKPVCSVNRRDFPGVVNTYPLRS